MSGLFDMALRARRRDRAARTGPALFLHQRAFDDIVERVHLIGRRFERAMVIGCPDRAWRDRLGVIADHVDIADPGPLFAAAAGGEMIVEDEWRPDPRSYDLIVAIGTLDTVNDLQLALRIMFEALRPDGLLIGAMSGGETLPRLRAAMRAADAISGVAAPHVHPRIEPSALATLLGQCGFAIPVVDVDRVTVSYRGLVALVADLRAMGATNILTQRPRPGLSRAAAAAAAQTFAEAAFGGRTEETFEIVHFAAWRRQGG